MIKGGYLLSNVVIVVERVVVHAGLRCHCQQAPGHGRRVNSGSDSLSTTSEELGSRLLLVSLLATVWEIGCNVDRFSVKVAGI